MALHATAPRRPLAQARSGGHRAGGSDGQDLLRLRSSRELFRLGDPVLVREKVSFPDSGTGLADAQVIVMRIDDTVGTDVDPQLDGLVVVFNPGDEAVFVEP